MRHAIYFAPPPGHPLHEAASSWLGRDAATGLPVPRPSIALPARDLSAKELLAEELVAVTGAPRRYGFHATLAAPFTLAPDRDLAGLEVAIAAFAARCRPFRMRLRPGTVGGFLALLPAGPAAAVNDLAAACLELADGFRAPPGAAELARRRAAALTPRQEMLLQRWGYPYVLDEYRFHMTLSERLDDTRRDRVMAAVRAHFAAVLAEPVEIDALTLFEEAAPGADFRHRGRFPFLAGEGAGAVWNETHA